VDAVFAVCLVGLGIDDLVTAERDLRWPNGRPGPGLTCCAQPATLMKLFQPMTLVAEGGERVVGEGWEVWKSFAAQGTEEYSRLHL
jgi:hypothetical protein